jgi:hypothetical protein
MRMVQDRLDPPRAQGDVVGGVPRQRIGLNARSRHALALWRRPDSPGAVTNRALLRKLKDRASADRPDEAERLRIDDSPLGDDWRPTVWFNPWMHQSGEQIWAGLAYEIISQITGRMRPVDREAFWLELNLRRVDADALRRRVHRALLDRLLPLAVALIAAAVLATVALLARAVLPGAKELLNLVATTLLGVGAIGGGLAGTVRAAGFWRERVAGSLSSLVKQPDYAQTWKQLTDNAVRDPGYEGRLGLLYLVQTDMRQVLDLVATARRPVVVFVDDLDRCSPGAVAQVIEAVNLFLAGQFPNCVFVVAMEPEMVAAHIEVAYQPLVTALAADDYWRESGTLGWRFLDKIVQLPVSLPSLRSDQAGQFLGSALVGGLRRKSAAGEEDLDAGVAQQIAEAIQSRRLSLGDLSEAAEAAQEQVVGSPVGAGGLRPEARAAVREELRRRLRPDNPEVQGIVAAAAGRLARNPREIKRFVNVFRFYAFIRQERVSDGLSAPDTLAEVAKLAVLAVRWPHLRAALGRQIGATERETVLALLEAPIAELAEDASWVDRRASLAKVLDEAQLPQQLRDALLASEELCRLLATGPPIGTAAAGFL